MPLDPAIFQMFRPKSVNEFQAESQNLENSRTAGEANQLQLMLGRQKADEYTRGVQDQNALRELQRSLSGVPREKLGQEYRARGYMAQGDAADKSYADLQKDVAATEGTRATTLKTGADQKKIEYETQRKKFEHRIEGLSMFTNPEDARQWLADGVMNGAMSMEEAKGMMGKVPKDQAAFDAWKPQALQSVMDAGKQMGFIRPDANAQLTAQTSTANNAASNARQAADNAASRAVQMRGQNLTDARSRESNAAAVSKPFEVTGPEGVPMLIRQDKAGNITDMAGNKVTGITPKGMGSTKLTEDQGKATGWLVQAENAFGNMQKAIDPVTGTPSAARPGLPDAVGAIPSFGIGEAVANTMRGKDRQKFMQGASSLSESLLRAATGAGVNKDEAKQKIQELTPVFGEKEETTAQKMAAIPLYIESLKVRAGPGAKQVAGIMDRGGKTDAGNLSAAEQAELAALRKQLGR